ncbi:uncharacterized protein LOC120337254 [Styela clava]
MASLRRSFLTILLLMVFGENIITFVEGGGDEEGGAEVDIPAHSQRSYQLYGLACFPIGLRLACNCEGDYYSPCCRDFETGDCYLPSFFKWSPWLLCPAGNELCDETQECRIKYEDVAQLVRPDSESEEGTGEVTEPIPVDGRRRRRAITPEEMIGLPNHNDAWIPEHHRCQVQRSECRPRETGEWGAWQVIGECSTSCHGGVISEVRDCFDLDGNEIDKDDCPGGEEQSHRFVPCNTVLCSDVSEWEDDEACFVDGVECKLRQTRICLSVGEGDPALTAECAEQTIDCPTDECDLSGVSGLKWGEWGDCNSTCTSGWHSRTATCVFAIDDSPSTDCDPLTDIEFEECDEHICHQYHEFAPDEDCSATCGDGTQRYTRTCVVNSLEVPDGCDEEMRSCNEGACPNYQYGDWTEWGPCDNTCGPGKWTRTGTCKDITTGQLSDQCTDGSTTTEEEDCNLDLCVEYSEWQDNTACSQTCGDGVVDQIRQCVTPGTDPTPNLPTECISQSNVPCNDGQCLTVGDWGEYGLCSSTCSPGLMTRERPCLDAETNEPATGCTEPLTESLDCNEDLCSEYGPASSNNQCLLYPGYCQTPSIASIQSCTGTGTALAECATTYADCTYSGPETDANILFIIDNTNSLDPNTCVPDVPLPADDPTLTDPAVSPNFIQQKKFIEDFACAWPYISGTKTTFAVQGHRIPVCGIPSDYLHMTFAEGISADAVESVMSTVGTSCASAMSYFTALACGATTLGTGRDGVLDIIILVVPEVTPLIENDIGTMTTDLMAGILRGRIGADTVVAAVSVTDTNLQSVYKLACLSAFADSSCMNYLGTIYDPINDVVSKLHTVLSTP